MVIEKDLSVELEDKFEERKGSVVSVLELENPKVEAKDDFATGRANKSAVDKDPSVLAEDEFELNANTTCFGFIAEIDEFDVMSAGRHL